MFKDYVYLIEEACCEVEDESKELTNIVEAHRSKGAAIASIENWGKKNGGVPAEGVPHGYQCSYEGDPIHVYYRSIIERELVD